MRRGEIVKNLSFRFAEFIAAISILKHLPSGFFSLELKALLAEPLANGIFKRPHEFGQGMRLVNVFDLYQSTSVIENALDRVPVTEDEYKRFNAKKGDVFFCRSSIKPEGVGWTSYLENEEERSVFECHLIRARVDQAQINPAYLSNYLRGTISRKYILAHANVTTMATIAQGVVEAIPIVLPPLEVQNRLVNELDAARAERDRALAEAERLLHSIDEYLLAKLAILPKPDERRVFAVRLTQVKPRLDADYHSPYFQQLRRAIEHSKHATRNLGDLAVFMRTGFAAGRQDQARGDEAAVPHLRPLNLNPWGELSITETKSVPASSVKEDDYLKKGEVLFNNTNSAEWVGKTAVFDLETPCACSNHMTRIALKPGVEPYFFAALLNAFRGIGYFSALSTFFNNQAGINTATLTELRVPLPDFDTQQAIAREVVDRKDKARQLQSHAETIWQQARERFEQQLLKGGAA